MRPIEGKLFSPFQKTIYRPKPSEGGFFGFTMEPRLTWERMDATVNRVRASEGFPVKSFRELIDEVAHVTLSNKNYEMYYRGQTKDYKSNQAAYYQDRVPKSIIYPSICRPERKSDGTLKHSIKQTQVQKRYDDLANMVALVTKKKKHFFNEHYYSLFQHYDILPTPFIDITQSLRVAATFALNNSETGYVYVFGLPYPSQSISYFVDLGMVLIKLQNVVPVNALRPRYQEGYLVGKYPVLPTKSNDDNLANRMVAKFFVDNTNGDFWDEYFLPMPNELLYPPLDEIEKELMHAKKLFNQKYYR
ncbi:FRG domain-containing protein [Flavobacterium rhizosphaerae]|uniref:FRG domain-containing protein n=1 Tax=Flavobacterium rhizosphaerae TaxID=3163298 RepID=A0ABW8YZ81_9FLAO